MVKLLTRTIKLLRLTYLAVGLCTCYLPERRLPTTSRQGHGCSSRCGCPRGSSRFLKTSPKSNFKTGMSSGHGSVGLVPSSSTTATCSSGAPNAPDSS